MRGVVQGVGFRPFVYALARELGLSGWVKNTAHGVVIEAEGPRRALEEFQRGLVERAPALARVASVAVESVRPSGRAGFQVLASPSAGERQAVVPPDAAMCSDCRREVLDPSDRHHLYPFTNCTACGPRFTIVRGVPYDRRRTTMSRFPMCTDCEREYHDPADRRFHAQPTACPRCGPRAWLADRRGRPLGLPWAEGFARLVREGRIVAVKGLGGFHLACDALNPSAVAELRRRKGRPFKPLAVMARDLDAVRCFCRVSPAEEQLLLSPEAPIVVLEQRPEAATQLSGLAPGLRSLGVMLPYTPLHLLLFQEGFTLLVMTSGNEPDAPLVKDNTAALAELRPLADAFLLHDRQIYQRCDDSVVRAVDGAPQLYRRARGHVPRGVELPGPPAIGVAAVAAGFKAVGSAEVGGGAGAGGAAGVHACDASEGSAGAAASTAIPAAGPLRAPPPVLAVGGELKNTFCLTRGSTAFLSQHIGDLASLENEAFFRQSLARLQRFLAVKPGAVAYDLHPGYLSTRLAAELLGLEVDAIAGGAATPDPSAHRVRALSGPRGLLGVGVQHHHAHLCSCLADNGFPGPAVGVMADGTGYGLDGRVWGLEVLGGDLGGFSRLYHLEYLPLVGGEAAVREPLRLAVGCLAQFAPDGGLEWLLGRHPGRAAEIQVWWSMARSGVNSPLASSCGRLFDAASALLGVCLLNTYEAQAASELGEVAWPDVEDAYPVVVEEGGGTEGPKAWDTPPPAHPAAEPAACAGGPRASQREGVADPGRSSAPPAPTQGAGAAGSAPGLSPSPGRILAGPIVLSLWEDVRAGVPPGLAAARFHNAVAVAMVEAARRAAEACGVDRVALSGGSFQNPLLLARVRRGLEAAGLKPLLHRQVPANDGGLSLGQAAAAHALLRGGA
ncbi:MAG: carbamoyltransferase HypF [Acetobacteraceae bacterium]|nr:carbamoyltransferase HypF [Acetobacteraceae bacterium]